MVHFAMKLMCNTWLVSVEIKKSYQVIGSVLPMLTWDSWGIGIQNFAQYLWVTFKGFPIVITQCELRLSNPPARNPPPPDQIAPASRVRVPSFKTHETQPAQRLLDSSEFSSFGWVF